MRAAPVLALAASLVACASPDASDTDRPNGGSNGESSAERLGVPAQYHMLWNTTEPCLTADDEPGIQVYRHSGDAESTVRGSVGSLRATETWYWFHGDNSPLDCKDTFDLSAIAGPAPYEVPACEGCEELWAFTRVLTEGDCPYDYAAVFGALDRQTDPEPFEGLLLFDTHTSAGQAHDDGRMGIAAVYFTEGRDVVDPDYAIRGMTRRVAADPARLGAPASYTWVGASCIAETR